MFQPATVAAEAGCCCSAELKWLGWKPASASKVRKKFKSNFRERERERTTYAPATARYVRSQRWLARLQLKPSHLSRAKHCIVRWAAERPEAGASENQRPLLQPHGIKKNPCPQIEMKSRSFETCSTDGDGDDDVDLDCILIIV